MGGRVVVAPDKFKGSLTGAEVAARVAAGLARGGFAGEVVCQPVADGGGGRGAGGGAGTLTASVSPGVCRVEVAVHGPTGAPVTAAYALRGEVAVVEAAQACGL